MKVVHLTRKVVEGMYSIEGTFAAMRGAMGPEFDIREACCPHLSKGVWPRIANVWAARKAEGDLQHILGDVHYLALGTRRKTTVLTICDCGFAYHPVPWKRALLRLLWLRLPVRLAARICAISTKTKAEILSLTKVDPAKIEVIPVCIDDVFQPSPKVFRSSAPQVLQVGTGPNKNVPRLIAALKGLACELHIVGRRTVEIDEALKANPLQCRFSSQLSVVEMAEAYKQADIVSFVSTYEGFGMPIVEAQAVGRVVVTSALDPMRTVAGGGAALADPISVESIRAELVRVIEDRDWREGLIEIGFANASKYRVDVVAAAYRRVYAEVLAESAGNRL